MIYFFVFSFSIIILISSLFGWRLESKFKIIAGTLTVLMVNQLLRVYPAFVYKYIELDATYPYFIFVFGFFSMLVGYFMVHMLLSTKSVSLHEYQKKPIQFYKESYLFLAVFITVVIAMLPSIYLYQGISPVIEGMLQQTTSDSAMTGELRREITKGHVFGGEYKGQGIIRVFNSVAWPFLLVLSIVGLAATGKTKWLLLSIAVAILSFNFLTADGTRGTLINVFVLLFITISFTKKLKLRHVILTVSSIFFIAIILSIFSSKFAHIDGDNFLFTAISQIAERIFIGNAQNDVYAINFINEGVIDIRYGALHLRDLTAALPGVGGGKPFAYELFMIMNPGSEGTTYLTGTYITKLYVDFDTVGVGLGLWLIGALAYVTQYYLLKRKKTIVNTSITTYMIFLIGGLVISGPISLLIQLMILGILLSFLLFIILFISAINFSHIEFRRP